MRRIQIINSAARVIAASGVLACCGLAYGQDCRLTPLGHVGEADTNQAAIIGTTAFTVTDNRFSVIDVSTPSSPVVRSTVLLPSKASAIAASGSLVYVATFFSNIQIIDVSDPAAPYIRGVAAPSGLGLTYKLETAGSMVYAIGLNASAEQVLHILDASVPGSLSIAGEYNADYWAAPSGVAISGNIAFVTTLYDGLHIVDVSNPSAPVALLTGLNPIETEVAGVAASSTTAFIFGYGRDDDDNFVPRISAIDVSVPSSPQVIGTISVPPTISAIEVVGNTAYVARGEAGLGIYRGEGGSVALLGSVDTPGSAVGLGIVGSTLVLADGSTGAKIVNVATAEAPVIVGSVDNGSLPADPRGFAYSGANLLVADGGNGLVVVDAANPASLAVRAVLDTPGEANGVAVTGTLALVADGDAGVRAYSLANPAAPVLLGVFDTAGTAMSVVIDGQLAFVADGFNGLEILDVSNPAAITRIGGIDPPPPAMVTLEGYASSVALSGDGQTAFIAYGTHGLISINVANPAQPIEADRLFFDIDDTTNFVVAQGSTVFAIRLRSGVHVLDASNPAALVALGTYNHDPAWETMRTAALSGDRLYVQTFEVPFGTPASVGVAADVVTSVNVSNPLMPIQGANALFPFVAQAIGTGDSTLVVGTPSSGVFTFSTATGPVVAVQPSPVTVASGGVAEFDAEVRSSEPVTYQWVRNGGTVADGGNISGSSTRTLRIDPVSAADAGSYIVQMSTPCGAAISSPATLTIGTVCAADFNGVGGITVQDIFDFLAAYFGSSPQADFNASGSVTVQDIFDFLAAYFTGC